MGYKFITIYSDDYQGRLTSESRLLDWQPVKEQQKEHKDGYNSGRYGKQKQDNEKHRKLNLKTAQVDKIRQKGIYAEGKYVNTHNSFWISGKHERDN